jgi:hypothetical protein
MFDRQRVYFESLADISAGSANASFTPRADISLIGIPLAHWKLAGAATRGVMAVPFGFSVLQMM